MKRDQHKSNKTSALREEAEKKIKPESVPIEKLSEAEVRKLAHELQVHKIELDMQNEELKRSQQELEDSRDRYARLYDFAPAGYFTINDEKTDAVFKAFISYTVSTRESKDIHRFEGNSSFELKRDDLGYWGICKFSIPGLSQGTDLWSLR